MGAGKQIGTLMIASMKLVTLKKVKKMQILQRVINTNLVLSIWIGYQINWIISNVVVIHFFSIEQASKVPIR